MPDKKIKVERKLIDVDTKYENMLEWIKEGHRLFFVSTDEKFIQLNDEQLGELPMEVKRNYRMAKADYDKIQGTFKDDVLELLSASVEYGTAQEKLDVQRDVRETKELKWVRPEQIRKFAAKGWNVAKTERKSQRGLRNGEYHAVGKNELILMEIDKRKYIALEEAKDQNRRKLFEQQADDMKMEAERFGMKSSYDTSSEDINIPLT